MRLNSQEIELDPGSVADPAGIVFKYKNRIFRAISDDYIEDYLKILNSNYATELFKTGLVKTWVTNYELEDYKLILEHEKIPILSTWIEWSTEMIKSATLTICKVNLELSKHGYILKDCQPGNVQFYNGKPIWIDFGSIIKLGRNNGFPHKKFRQFNLFPLWLMTKVNIEYGKYIYHEIGIGLLKKIISKKPLNIFPLKYFLIFRNYKNKTTTDRIRSLISYLDKFKIVDHDGPWTTYGQGGMPALNSMSQFTPKAKSVQLCLKKLKKGSLLDVASNKGWYAELAVSMGFNVICFDIDDASINYLFRKINKDKLPILPLVINLLKPTPPYSVALGKADSFNRLKSDTVLALAILHHLVFKQNLRFNTFAKIISSYCKDSAIIEFIPKEDMFVKKWYSSHYRWYKLSNLIIELNKYFDKIEIYDSFPSPRKLILCTERF